MARATLMQNPSGGAGITPAPMVPALDTTVVHPALGVSIDQVRQEIDDCFDHMASWHNSEPDDVMRLSGGYSARFSFLRVRAMRVEDMSREWKPIRTRELEPLLEELQNQWKNASRLQSVRELDWKMESGGT